MKKIKYILFALLFVFTSCEDWLNVNDDPNVPSEVSVEFVLPSGITSVAYVMGGRYQVLGALWSQHWTQSLGASQYTGLDSYDINSSTYDGQFGELYTGALENFDYIRNETRQTENWSFYLMATVMQAYTFQVLIDIYDQVPFSQALKGENENFTPGYEDGQVVYDSLILRIDEALDKDFEAETAIDAGKNDILFAGDIDTWIAFANSLKLKMYLRQSYARPEEAKNGIQKLFDDEVDFLSEDAAVIQFSDESGRRNPLYSTEIVFFGNNPNLVISNTFLSYMNEQGDLDRLDRMFLFPESGGGHNGLAQGNYNDPDEPAGTNSSSYSKPFISPLQPVYLMSATESYLLQAEAIVRYGVDEYSVAKENFERAIDFAFLRLGLTNSEEYYGPGDVYQFPPEGSELEDIIHHIIVQKWVSLANTQSLETFFEQNRTGYPKVSEVPYDNTNYEPGEFTISVNNVTSGRFPKRLIFPESEYSGNPNTPDKKEVWEKVWWDIN